MSMTIRGIQQAQQGNLKLIHSLKPSGSLGQAVKSGTVLAHQSSVRKTHVITGSLRASHRMKLNGLRGIIFLDPSSVNPRSHGKPADYGLAEHAKGGSHAFYRRVMDEDGRSIATAVGSEYLRGLPR